MSDPFWEEWIEEKTTYNVDDLSFPYKPKKRINWLDKLFIDLLWKLFFCKRYRKELRLKKVQREMNSYLVGNKK